MLREITLADIYAKLEKIESRLSRVESVISNYVASEQGPLSQGVSIRQKQPVVQIKTERAMSDETQEPPQGTTLKRNEKKKDEPEVDFTNWKSLLGFE